MTFEKITNQQETKMARYSVTLEQVENTYADVSYHTFGTTTICIITTVNGFKVVGDSSCIDPELFNPDFGHRIAYANARDKLWQILGYVNKERWYRETQLTWLDRLKDELANEDENIGKIKEFLESDPVIELRQLELLEKQLEAMRAKALILQDRIALANKDS